MPGEAGEVPDKGATAPLLDADQTCDKLLPITSREKSTWELWCVLKDQ
jgi:hypothetical protein